MEHYLRLAADIRTVRSPRVTVARPMTDEQRTCMRAALIALAGRDLDIQEIVDPEVIGGVRVELGDEVVDGSAAETVWRTHDAGWRIDDIPCPSGWTRNERVGTQWRN